MSYQFHQLWAKNISYGNTRSKAAIKYLVFHYTGNNTDTAKANANYFSPNGANNVTAGAHYFVDDNDVYQSIDDLRIAWSVGGGKYTDCNQTGGGRMYNEILNSNSISIEICSKNGTFTSATLENAKALAVDIMSRYGIKPENIYRHFDVNGKHCPGWAGWFGKDSSKWESFKADITKMVTNSPNDAVSAIKNLAQKGFISSPDYWIKNYSKVKYLDNLLVKCAEILVSSGKPCVDVNNAIDNLVELKVISSPDFWRKHYKDVQHLDILLRNLGGAVRTYRVKITATVLNVRCGVGMTNAVIGSVRKNTIVDVIGEFSDVDGNKWYKIKSPDGFISAAYTIKE